jgi:hypothetical protein
VLEFKEFKIKFEHYITKRFVSLERYQTYIRVFYCLEQQTCITNKRDTLSNLDTNTLKEFYLFAVERLFVIIYGISDQFKSTPFQGEYFKSNANNIPTEQQNRNFRPAGITSPLSSYTHSFLYRNSQHYNIVDVLENRTAITCLLTGKINEKSDYYSCKGKTNPYCIT